MIDIFQCIDEATSQFVRGGIARVLQPSRSGSRAARAEALSPTRIYLGKDEMQQIHRHRAALTHVSYGMEHVMGLRLFRVDADHHLAVFYCLEDLQQCPT